VLLDTGAHAARISSLFGASRVRHAAVWVGAEVDRFRPARPPAPGARSPRAPLKVLFYGQFIPLHRIQTIVEAARLAREEEVEWTIVGRGQEESAVQRMLDELPLPKVRRVEWVEYSALGRWIAAADVCLGIFGTSRKAAAVIPNKVYQVLAAGRPLITRDSPAIRELLAHAPPCVYLVPPGDPAALLEAVLCHRDHLQAAVHPPQCHAPLAERIGPSAVARQFLAAIAQVLEPHGEARTDAR
jgi:glycosyltransferase involved in cell wall biosynthesis